VQLMKRKIVICIFIVLIGMAGTFLITQSSNKEQRRERLLLNEICLHNDTVIYNEIGNYTDYVEIYNNSSETVNLSNYYLSDKKEQYNLYRLPDMQIEPYSYAVVYIDAETAGFAVGDRDTLYLTDGEENVFDMVELPYVSVDRVYARNADTLVWENNQQPTPQNANLTSEEPVEVINTSVNVNLSHGSGFYNEPFYLTMSTNSDYDIYYTLDGSTPTQSSWYYETPILIEDVTYKENVYSAREDISVNPDEVEVPSYPVDKCNVVRAVAIASDGTRSEETIATYFIDYGERYGYQDVYIVSLVTDPENLFDKDNGIYVTGTLADKNWFGVEDPGNAYKAIANYSREGKGWHRSAYIELFDPQKQYLASEHVNISIHGGFSVYYPQKGFNLLSVQEGEEENYLFSGIVGDKNTSLMLRSGGFRDWRVTKFRDALNHTLVEDRALTILRSVPCQVFLDGEYWGAYNLQERIDQGLIAQNFGVRKEDVIIFKNDNVLGADDTYYEEYLQVVNYAAEHDLSVEKHYDEMTKMIDIQSYIDYYCFQIYVANCDSVHNNYSAWKTNKITTEEYYDGKWRWVLYDTDEAMGIIEEKTDPDVDSFSAGHWSTTPMTDPLFSALIQNEDFKYQFVSTFIEMADNNFAYERVDSLIDQYCDTYMEAFVVSRTRYDNSVYTEERYLEKVEVIRNFFKKRRSYIVEHLEKNLGIEDVEEYLNRRNG